MLLCRQDKICVINFLKLFKYLHTDLLSYIRIFTCTLHVICNRAMDNIHARKKKTEDKINFLFHNLMPSFT